MNLRALAERVARSEPRLGRTRLVLIDGPSGAGKTTLSLALAGSIPAEIVHTDDLVDGWDGQFTYWDRLEGGVLAPISAGFPGQFQAYDWYQSKFDQKIDVPAADVLIVEGVGAGRERGRALASLTVFVDAPLPVRQARSMARDGAEMQEHLRRWRHREVFYFAADATSWCSDVVIGSSS